MISTMLTSSMVTMMTRTMVILTGWPWWPWKECLSQFWQLFNFINNSLLTAIWIYSYLSKTRMYWAVLGCTELHITGCAWLYWALQSYTRLCWAVLGYNGLCSTVLGWPGLYWAITGSARLCWADLGCSGMWCPKQYLAVLGCPGL